MKLSNVGLASKTTLLVAAAASALAFQANASSHREGPFITSLPKVDGTDFYMFRSYESGREHLVIHKSGIFHSDGLNC